ncbi:MAG TPA: branched-chain amino acid ABC transporter permease [Myxococcales bacterium]|nr:branched-chain amino acid ABC transporter permease [Myxococcales bacterium]
MLCGEFHTTYAGDMAIFETRRGRRALVVFVVALFAFPLVATSYWLDVANRAAIAVIAAMGLNILTGYTGQISLGNAAFLAVGAYTTAFLGSHGAPFVVACPASGIVAALAGMVFGIPSLRLKGLYLAMATLAAHFIVEFTITHWEVVTGGVSGSSVPSPRLFGYDFADDRRLFFLIVPACIAHLWFAKNLFRTRVGKAFVAIRDQDISAEVMGVTVFRHKLLSFAVSSFYIGVAGSLLAYQARIISPESFPLALAIDYLGMIIIGGLGSVLGSVLGAVFLTLLPEVLRLLTGALSSGFPQLVQLFSPLKLGVFGLTIVLFLVFEPEGLADLWRRIRNWFRLYPFSY